MELRYRKPTSKLVCHTGGICYDTVAVTRHAEALVSMGLTPQSPFRCPNADAHPDRPYHFARRPVSRSAA